MAPTVAHRGGSVLVWRQGETISGKGEGDWSVRDGPRRHRDRVRGGETRPDWSEKQVGTPANEVGTAETYLSATKKRRSAIATGPSATALRFRAWATGSAERVTEVGGAAIGSAIRWIRVAGVVIERHGSKQEVSGRSDGLDGWRFVFGGW